MNKLQKVSLTLVFIIMAAWIAYAEGVKFYQVQKTLWLNTGALQMRQAVFEAVEKGEVKLSNAKGERTITIIKK